MKAGFFRFSSASIRRPSDFTQCWVKDEGQREQKL